MPGRYRDKGQIERSADGRRLFHNRYSSFSYAEVKLNANEKASREHPAIYILKISFLPTLRIHQSSCFSLPVKKHVHDLRKKKTGIPITPSGCLWYAGDPGYVCDKHSKDHQENDVLSEISQVQECGYAV
jgi:hypothetical protein